MPKVATEMQQWDAVCDSYAEENKRFWDEIELLRGMLRKIAAHPDAPPIIKQYAEGRLHGSDMNECTRNALQGRSGSPSPGRDQGKPD
jgi:hypothetical protein